MTFILQRMVQLVPVLIGVSIITFLMLHLTGDPAVVILGPEATREAIAQLRTELGLNDPLHVQYGRFLIGAVQGDFGLSTRYRQPAFSLFVERLPATLELAFFSLLFSVVVGTLVGVLAAVYRNTAIDSFVRIGALVGQAIPNFYLGLIAIIIFAAQLRWLPAGGRGTWQHLVLPVFALGTFYSAITARFVRGAMLEVMEADFVRTARAKGLRSITVLFRHAFRNALIGVVTLVGLQTGSLLSGAVVTETVFSWPGIGRMAVQSIYTRDFPVVQVTIVMTAVLFVVINLVTDILYTVIDPRIRKRG
jgi:ABC-type dipeptide/oligopeptide/nickel transport system permease component